MTTFPTELPLPALFAPPSAELTLQPESQMDNPRSALTRNIMHTLVLTGTPGEQGVRLNDVEVEGLANAFPALLNSQQLGDELTGLIIPAFRDQITIADRKGDALEARWAQIAPRLERYWNSPTISGSDRTHAAQDILTFLGMISYPDERMEDMDVPGIGADGKSMKFSGIVTTLIVKHQLGQELLEILDLRQPVALDMERLDTEGTDIAEIANGTLSVIQALLGDHKTAGPTRAAIASFMAHVNGKLPDIPDLISQARKIFQPQIAVRVK